MKDYFKDSIIYYYNQLLREGCDDPLRVVISDLLDTIDVPKEQEKYLLEISSNHKKDLENIILILKKMKLENKIDGQAINLIIKKINQIIRD